MIKTKMNFGWAEPKLYHAVMVPLDRSQLPSRVNLPLPDATYCRCFQRDLYAVLRNGAGSSIKLQHTPFQLVDIAYTPTHEIV
jgi:hypothetical protein